MAAKLTEYERVVSILTRKEKAALIAYCDENNFRATQVVREAIKYFLKKKGIDL